MRRPTAAFLASALTLAVAVAVAAPPNAGPDLAADTPSATASPSPASPTPSEPEEGGEARGANEEAEEQAEKTEKRLEALAEAIADGRFGTEQAVTNRAAPGWAGEQVLDATKDDWEPAIAADPNRPFVYLLTTRYGVPKPCKGNCPVPYITLTISKDGGETWGRTRPLCACKGTGQFDPIVEVVPNTGHVYALYMNGFNVVFVKSADRGRTWTDPVPTWGKVAWNDKPTLATSADGRHVYASWNGPVGGDPWLAQSHDFGRTWTQTRLANGKRYYFAYDGVILDDGTVVITNSSFTYSGPAASAEGAVHQHLFISRDRGRTWTNQVMDRVRIGPSCITDGCYADFHSGHSGISADEDGDLVYVYDGARRDGGPQSAWVRTSTDGGRTWSDRRRLSRAGVHTTGPVVEATGNGDFRAWYAEQGAGGRWNIYLRRSRNGGASWGAPVLLSDATSGAGYKDQNGFLEFYGDYGEIAITSDGKTVAAWGEAFSYLGPGGAWTNVQV